MLPRFIKGKQKNGWKNPNFIQLPRLGLYIYYCLFISSGATVATPNHYNDWEKLYIFDKLFYNQYLTCQIRITHSNKNSIQLDHPGALALVPTTP